MSRFRILVGLVSVLSMLAISASPASANFQAKAQWKGVVKVVKSGEFVDEKAVVKCPANEIEAQWSIQSKGVLGEHEKNGKQVQVKDGPQLHIKVTNWGKGCIATVALGKLGAKVKPCELQIYQLPGSLKGTGGVATTCEIEISTAGCTLTVPAGKETKPESDEGTNVGLKEVSLENKGENLFTTTSITGVTVEPNKEASCGVKTNSTSELKGLVALIEGVNAV